MANLQSSPYLPRQRNFPNSSSQELGVELDKSYVDIANRVNERTIGLYPINFAAITGEKWYFTSTPQQSLRQVYQFTAAGSIAHGIQWNSAIKISPRSYGSFTDGTNWFGVIYADSNPIAGQISFWVSPTNIIILAGAGANPIVSGFIDLEWISNI